jgi:hypothetical protein
MPDCKSSTCDLADLPNSGYIYGSNQWFKVSSAFGTGYTPANELGRKPGSGMPSNCPVYSARSAAGHGCAFRAF